MKIYPRVTCPYCLTTFTIGYDLAKIGNSYTIAQCDNERGGCERRFVVKFFVECDVTVKRVQGQETEEGTSAVVNPSGGNDEVRSV